MYIDSHTHIDFCLEKNTDNSLTKEALISELIKKKIKFAVQVSTESETYKWSHNLAREHSNILFTLGIHPSSKAGEKELDYLKEYLTTVLADNDRKLLFAIGETGLDFYRKHQPKEMQIRSFEFQLNLAEQYNLPVVIHSREAAEDTLLMLRKIKPALPIMHCFSGDSNAAKKFLDLGCMISFAGNVTYKSAVDLKDAAAYVPLNMLLLETDAPFLTPAPLRGRPNRPEYITHTYDFLAELRNEKLSLIIDNIYKNFYRLIPGRQVN